MSDERCHWCSEPRSIHGTEGRPPDACEWDMQTMHYTPCSAIDERIKFVTVAGPIDSPLSMAYQAHMREVAAQSADEEPDSLDAAWAEAEATRRGWVVQGLHAFVEETSEHGVITGWEAQAMDPLARFSERGEGPTPAAALRALAAKLRMLPVMDTTR
jgi:hypothetical protein